MKKEECFVAYAKLNNDSVVILGGIENCIPKIEVIKPKYAEAYYKMKFQIAYNSQGSEHGYSTTGGYHRKPTFDCISHILREHMFGVNSYNGLKSNSNEKLIFIEEPKNYKKEEYLSDTIFWYNSWIILWNHC